MSEISNESLETNKSPLLDVLEHTTDIEVCFDDSEYNCILCLDSMGTIHDVNNMQHIIKKPCECKYLIHDECLHELLQKDKKECLMCKMPFEKGVYERSRDTTRCIIRKCTNATYQCCDGISLCLKICSSCIVVALFLVFTSIHFSSKDDE